MSSEPAAEPPGRKPPDQPPGAGDILSSRPEQLSRVVGELVQQTMLSIGPAPNPILKHFTREHLTKLLEATERANERAHQRETERIQFLPRLMSQVVGLTLGTILLLCVLFLSAGQGALLMQVIIPILTFVTGFIGGLGAGKLLDKKEE